MHVSHTVGFGYHSPNRSCGTNIGLPKTRSAIPDWLIFGKWEFKGFSLCVDTGSSWLHLEPVR